MRTQHPTFIDKVLGRATEAWGKLTGNDRVRAAGHHRAVEPEEDPHLERVGHGGPPEGHTQDGRFFDTFWHHGDRPER